jgi:hypothetical protein
MSKFPTAEKVEPLFKIAGVLHQRIPASEALKLPEAIRASVAIESGPDKGGEKICWFVRLEADKAVEEDC